MDILNEEMISAHHELLIDNSEFKKFISDGRIYDLQRMNTLLKRIGKQGVMKAGWVRYLKE